MRDTAYRIIKEAAEAIGLPEASVMEKPRRRGADILLPDPRMEIEWMGERFARCSRRLAVVPGEDPEKTRTVRKALYTAELTVRCELVSEDGDWIEDAYRRYLLSLPRKIGDSDGNLVVIGASSAVRGGYVSGLVDVLGRRSNAVHVVFRGFVCRDEQVPWLKWVDIAPYWAGFPRGRLCSLVVGIGIEDVRLRDTIGLCDASAIEGEVGIERSVWLGGEIERCWYGLWSDRETWWSHDTVCVVGAGSQ